MSRSRSIIVNVEAFPSEASDEDIAAFVAEALEVWGG
jgi:hypothetical protein